MAITNKIIVFAPHPDDETLGCGGTIIKRLKEGYEVIIVILTDGRHALTIRGIKNNPCPDEVVTIRKEELLKATQILGVPRENLLYWAFEDMSLAKKSDEVSKRCMELLTKIQPLEIFIPSKKDSSIDHRVANRILRNCVQQLNFPITVYQYSIAQRFLHLGPFLEKIKNFLMHNMISINIIEYNHQKATAIDAYNSQIRCTTGEKGKLMLRKLDKFLTGFENFTCFNHKGQTNSKKDTKRTLLREIFD